jgi:hypothetical protein
VGWRPLEGRRLPSRDERKPPEVCVGSSSEVDCVGADLEDDVVGCRISESGGRIPVEASFAGAEERAGADSAVLEVVGWTISEDGGRVPVGRCATGALVVSLVSVGA